MRYYQKELDRRDMLIDELEKRPQHPYSAQAIKRKAGSIETGTALTANLRRKI